MFPKTLLLVLFACTSLLAAAQTGQSTKDSRAITIIQQAIATSGGAATIAAAGDCTVRGTFQKSSANGTSNATKTFIWTVSGEEFRRETNDGTNTNVFVSGHGHPGMIRKGTQSALNYHVARAALPYHLPALVLYEEWQNTNYTITYLGSAVVNGKNALHIHTSDDSDKVGKAVTPQEWYFDPSTFLPLRVEYRLPSNDNAANYRKGSFDFLAWESKSGLAVPTQLTYSEDDKFVAAVLINSVSINSGTRSGDFDLTQGAQAQ